MFMTEVRKYDNHLVCHQRVRRIALIYGMIKIDVRKSNIFHDSNHFVTSAFGLQGNMV